MNTQDIFLKDPATLTVFRSKIIEERKKQKQATKMYYGYSEFLSLIKNKNSFAFNYLWLRKLLCKMQNENAEMQIAKWEKLLKRAKWEQSGKENKNNIDIATLKEIPITELLPNGTKTREAYNRVYTCCPFHNEDTPSLVIYKDSNSFFCYGCHKGGDNIKFLELLHGWDFKDVVKYLSTNCG